MKIIFLTSTPLPIHLGKMLKIDQLLKYNIDVEIWNLESLFFEKKSVQSYYKNKKIRFNFKKYYNIKSLKTLEKKLHKNKKYYFIHLTKYHQLINDDLLIRKLNKFKIKYLVSNFDPRDLYYQFKDFLKFPLRFVKRKLRYNCFSPKAIITSGSSGDTDANLFFPKTTVLSIPSIKVNWKKTKKIIKQKYICFIDENIGFSPDAHLLNITQSDNISLYYKNIKKLFNKIEKWYNLKIIVGASGKHIYKNKKKFFGNRKIIYRNTLNLIQNSEFVIAHGSLAIDQAFVSKKHILTIDERSLTKLKKKDWIYYDNFLKNKRLYTDEIKKKNIDQLLKINLDYYTDYIKKYLKKERVKKSFSEIIFDYSK